jgi:hypothetical protein
LDNAKEAEGDVLDDLRSNHFTRSTPSREGVEDNNVVLLERGVEFDFAIHTYHVSICPSVNSQRTRPNIPANVMNTHLDSGTLKSSCAV